MKLNKQIFGWLGVSALLLTTACTANDTLSSEPQTQGSRDVVYGNGSHIVTLTLEAEGSIATRYDVKEPTISDGSKVEVLIFAVYQEETDASGNKSYQLAKQFQSVNPNFQGSGVILGEGQNAIPAKYVDYPLNIKLALDPERKYRIALWAQKSSTKAFDTSNLKAVKVDYRGLTNNFEEFDAFSAVSRPISGSTTETQHITLTRPFAQINLGTTGADYKHVMTGKYQIPNKRPRFSKIALKGVADTYNVLTGKSTVSNDLKATQDEDGCVVLDWALIPAYISKLSPGFPSFTNNKNSLEESIKDYTENLLNATGKNVPDEEFLKVKLNEDSKRKDILNWYDDPKYGLDKNHDYLELFGYKTSYPTMWYNSSKKPLYFTETFKYLSMCYVLVESEVKSNQTYDDDADATKDYGFLYNGSTLEQVKIYLAEDIDGFDYYFDSTANPVYQPYSSTTVLKLSNVPVNHNWRTNILAGLKDTLDDDDPEDETSIVKALKICVHLDPIFWNEYNGFYNQNDDNTLWSNPNGDGSVLDGNGFDWSGFFPGTGEDNDLHDQYNQNMHED